MFAKGVDLFSKGAKDWSGRLRKFEARYVGRRRIGCQNSLPVTELKTEAQRRLLLLEDSGHRMV